MDDLEFEFKPIHKQPFSSRRNDNNEFESFVLSEMSGGKMKKGEIKLFINRSDRKKGLVINDPQDLPALLMLLKHADQLYNK